MSESSSLSFRGAQFTGPPRAVLAALVIVAVAVLVGLWMWLGAGDDGGGEVEIDVPISTVLEQDPGDEFGSSWLDELEDLCLAGDLFACDDLFYESPIGSGWETVGASCGGLDPSGSSAGVCAP